MCPNARRLQTKAMYCVSDTIKAVICNAMAARYKYLISDNSLQTLFDGPVFPCKVATLVGRRDYVYRKMYMKKKEEQ